MNIYINNYACYPKTFIRQDVPVFKIWYINYVCLMPSGFYVDLINVLFLVSG